MQVSLNILLMAGKFLNKWHDKIINAARRVTKDMVEASMDVWTLFVVGTGA